jgi:hypothetical protein
MQQGQSAQGQGDEDELGGLDCTRHTEPGGQTGKASMIFCTSTSGGLAASTSITGSPGRGSSMVSNWLRSSEAGMYSWWRAAMRLAISSSDPFK